MKFRHLESLKTIRLGEVMEKKLTDRFQELTGKIAQIVKYDGQNSLLILKVEENKEDKETIIYIVCFDCTYIEFSLCSYLDGVIMFERNSSIFIEDKIHNSLSVICRKIELWNDDRFYDYLIKITKSERQHSSTNFKKLSINDFNCTAAS